MTRRTRQPVKVSRGLVIRIDPDLPGFLMQTTTVKTVRRGTTTTKTAVTLEAAEIEAGSVVRAVAEKFRQFAQQIKTEDLFGPGEPAYRRVEAVQGHNLE
jgi:hypothetical protein